MLQLAAHVERVPTEDLYLACAVARAVMSGEHAVGRVIARPFTGEQGAFARTEGRRDLALAPPARSYLQELQDAGIAVHGVGKIDDLFAGVGIDEAHAGATNARALEELDGLVGGDAGPVLEAARLAVTMRRTRSTHLERLREGIDPAVPLLYLPYLFTKSHGLRTTRQVAGSLGEELGL